jgi:hypothetical protein
MASSLDHFQQAQSNEGFYEALGADSSTTPEWAMTVLFYSALHYVQAALIHLQSGSAPTDHDKRRGAVRTQFRSIAGKYEALYNASIRARYECARPKPAQLASAQQELRAIATEIAKTAPPALYEA